MVGGENLAKLKYLIIPANSIDPQITRDLYERCRNSVNRQTNFVKHLTPAQLDFKVDAGEDDLITRALFIHRINAILLYIADRSVIRNKIWISIFISTEQSIEIN